MKLFFSFLNILFFILNFNCRLNLENVKGIYIFIYHFYLINKMILFNKNNLKL